jgi:flagellin
MYDTANNVVGYSITSREYGSDEEFALEISGELADDLGVKLDPNDDTISQVEKEDGSNFLRVERAGVDASVTTSDGFTSTSTTISVDGLRIKVTDIGGFSIDFMFNEKENTDLKENPGNEKEVAIKVTDIGAMTLQIGANQYQDMDVCIPEISAKSLYLDTVDVTVTNGPDKALNTLDEAISKLGDVRSGIGAYTNRLEYAANSLSETQEDITSAYANLMDTDMAEEMTEYTQLSVLEQASISVLSQANDLPQQVLSLLQ